MIHFFLHTFLLFFLLGIVPFLAGLWLAHKLWQNSGDRCVQCEEKLRLATERRARALADCQSRVQGTQLP